MVAIKIHTDKKINNEIKKVYGNDDYNTISQVIGNILVRYLKYEHFDKELIIKKGKLKLCNFCGEKAVTNKIIDINGLNLEECEICQNCGSGTPKID